ncbi:hypothetical protein D1871_23035 [Nakamurella silvestris]|nr:hypothetical protein D1871_23035 [Nakamurella silvestris]
MQIVAQFTEPFNPTTGAYSEWFELFKSGCAGNGMYNLQNGGQLMGVDIESTDLTSGGFSWESGTLITVVGISNTILGDVWATFTGTGLMSASQTMPSCQTPALINGTGTSKSVYLRPGVYSPNEPDGNDTWKDRFVGLQAGRGSLVTDCEVEFGSGFSFGTNDLEKVTDLGSGNPTACGFRRMM